MNEKPPSTSGPGGAGVLARVRRALKGDPWSREEIHDLLQQAETAFDPEEQDMLAGVFEVAETQVRDVMVPRSQMVVIERDQPLDEMLETIIRSGHSRFPVIGEDRAEVVGILLAKDLLQYCGDNTKRFNIRNVLRNAVFVPESKRLNVLLKEFRTTRNHMAIVIDEYGTAAGLVTIEDVLEQIVGEIEDEYDFDDDVQILQRSEHEFTMKAQLDIDDFNEHFKTSFSDDEFDTVGGLVTNALGHLPKNGETVVIDGFEFRVIRADSRKIRLLAVRTPPADE